MRSLLLAALLPFGAFAQQAAPEYNPGVQAGETYAQLFAATIVPRFVAEQVVTRCTAEAPALAEAARTAAGEWQQRNAHLELAATRLYENVAERIGSEIGADTFNGMRRKIDETVRSGTTELTKAIFDANFGKGKPAERQAACDGLLKQMREGKLDIAAIQPAGYRLIADASALLGRWKSLSSTIQLADGTFTRSPASVQCWNVFTVTTITTECESPSVGRYHSVSKYMLVGPGEYRAETISNERAPQMVGFRSMAEFKIGTDRMVLTSYPPSIKGNPPKAPVKVVGEWERVE